VGVRALDEPLPGSGAAFGAPDPTLPAVSGMAAVTELVDRLGLIEYLGGAVGPI
jgi:hypothetical protein